MKNKRRVFAFLKWAALLAALLSFALPAGLKEFSKMKDKEEISAFVAAPRASATYEIEEETADYNEMLKRAGISTHDPWAKGSGTQNEMDEALAAMMKKLADSPQLSAALLIPSIDLEIPVYYGTSEAVLSKGSGILERTFMPTGEKGQHTVIAGHRGTYYHRTFHDLDGVKLGDEFVIITPSKLLSYKVIDISIVNPDKMDAVQIEEDRSLVTLVTCDPIPAYTKRLLVKGELLRATALPRGTTLDALLQGN